MHDVMSLHNTLAQMAHALQSAMHLS